MVTPAPVRQGRFRELDGLRGIAAVAVMFAHFTVGFDEYFPGHSPPPFTFRVGGYGVHLFFLISGYVIYWTAERSANLRVFAVSRFTRLYPTFWVCLAITLAATIALGNQSLIPTAKEILGNVTMVPRLIGVRSIDGAYWSLSVEMLFYLLIAVVILRWKSISRAPMESVILVWLVFSVSVILAEYLRGGAMLHALAVFAAAEHAPLFCAGMLLFRSDGSPRSPLLWACLAAASLNAFLTTGWSAGIVVAVIGVCFTLIVRREQVPALRVGVLQWLGAISYPLYLLHQNIAYAMLRLAVPAWGRIPGMLGAIGVILLAAWGVHLAIEMRLSRWLRRVLLGRSARPAPRVPPLS